MSKKNLHSDFTSFRNYYLGKMSPEDKNDFEKNIEADPFAKEALEGFTFIESDFDRISIIENTNMKIKEELGLETSNVFPIKSFMAIAASVVLFIGSYFFISNNNSTENNLAENKVEIIEDQNVNTNEIIIKDTVFGNSDSLLMNDLEIDEDVIVTDIPLADKTELKNKFKKEGKKAIATKQEKTEINVVEALVNKEIGLEETKDDLTIEGYKKTTTDFQSSTSMNSIAIDRQEFEETSIELDKISNYKKAIVAYNKGEHSKAIRYFNKSISDKNNINSSNFYIGMSYFNQGKSTKAIKYFNKLNSTSFKDKAEWYKSLSLLNKGKKSEAKAILEKIATSNSSFRDKAMNKLLSL